MAEDELPEADDEAEQAYREDEAALFEALDGVMEERGIGEHDLVPMLLAAAYHYRSLAYVADTAKPSEAGLKMDLDRLRKIVDEVHRGYRKQASVVLKDMVDALDSYAVAAGDEADIDHEAAGPPKVISDGSGR